MQSKLLVSFGETRAVTRPRLGLTPNPPGWMLHSILVIGAPRYWAKKADMLTDLAASAQLFHSADGTAFADLMIDGHRETWPVRSIRMRSWLRRMYYQATGAAAGAGAINSALDLLEATAQFEAPRRAFTSAWRSVTVASIWILLTSCGARLRSGPKDGKLQHARRSDFAGLPACYRSRCR